MPCFTCDIVGRVVRPAKSFVYRRLFELLSQITSMKLMNERLIQYKHTRNRPSTHSVNTRFHWPVVYGVHTYSADLWYYVLIHLRKRLVTHGVLSLWSTGVYTRSTDLNSKYTHLHWSVVHSGTPLAQPTLTQSMHNYSHWPVVYGIVW